MSNRTRWLDLAGLRVRVESDEGLSEDPGILANFLTEAGSADHVLRTELLDQVPPPTGTELYNGGALRIFRDGETIVRYIGDVEVDPSNAYIRAVSRKGEIRASYRRADIRQGITAKLLLNALDLTHLLTTHQGFLLHASFIEHEGRAILFTAPSETGKSTQAQLWCDHMGAELVNGDRAAVRIIDGAVCACGIPYSGSSPVRRNVTLPLAAIVYLSQAPENTITRLRGVRSFRRVWEGCTVNVWDREDVTLATGTVGEVVTRVPVYHLACTPDVRAVELLKQTMEVEP